MSKDVPAVLAVLSYPLTLLPTLLIVHVYDMKHPARPMRQVVHDRRLATEFRKYAGPC
jgi:hypothetical protein